MANYTGGGTNFSGDEIFVSISGTIEGLVAAMEESATVVKTATESMSASLEGTAVATQQYSSAMSTAVPYVRGLAQASTSGGRAMAMLELQAYKIDASMKAVASSATTATSGLRKAESGSTGLHIAGRNAAPAVVAMSYGLESLARSGNAAEGGIRAATRSLAVFAAGFGVGGVIVTAVITAGQAMYEFWSQQKAEANSAREAIEKDLAALANAGNAAGIQAKARALYFGTPYTEDGKKMMAVSDRVKGAFSGSIADLRAQRAELESLIKNAPNMLVASALAGQEKKLDAVLQPMEEKLRALHDAAVNLANQPVENAGVLSPVVTRAKSDDTLKKEREQEAKDEAEAQKKRMADFNEDLDWTRKQKDRVAKENDERRQKELDAENEQSEMLNRIFRRGSEVEAAARDAAAKALQDMQDSWVRAFDRISGAWGAAIASMQGTTFGLLDVFRAVLREMLVEYIGYEVRRAIIRNAAFLEEVKQGAIMAAVNTYKSIAAIPVVGPFLAPAAALAALAGVLALAHGGGGGGAPSGGNQAAQAPTRGSNTTIIVHAMDAKSFHGYMMANSDIVAKAAIAGASNGVRMPTSPGRGSA